MSCELSTVFITPDILLNDRDKIKSNPYNIVPIFPVVVAKSLRATVQNPVLPITWGANSHYTKALNTTQTATGIQVNIRPQGLLCHCYEFLV